ncbi:tRNA (mnm(5)s(2)U34)-methyltransferase [Luteolibacter luteus]|uniref:Methyltransferase domain-containing protein n=1 Tax=Luteolibacter luteus TaxID=2728835 RepID=A0A858RD93_9BACT|nr:class I SAM-dependent methyltransferase [Luteolibacter luteus]QJE94777.1 methyltransferase domain-containing protein [Luteolibacter luteus]
MSAPERPTARAHRELAEVIRPGDLAIDATAGNGHDTVFLAEQVGESGRVIAYDIQAEAIASTRSRLEAVGLEKRVTLIQGSHARLSRDVDIGSVAAVVFNLGYLPGGDHAVITLREETLSATRQALDALRAGGLLAMVCYPGHAGGDEESEAVLAWVRDLDASLYDVEVARREGTLRPAPFLILVRKKVCPQSAVINLA